MYVELHRNADEQGARAADLISACVHCGFCLATCPTYLDSGDERDSPRGRIYLIKQLLEEDSATALTRTHLDRCLGCRSCETTCPSGMQYGKLADIGRGLLERTAPRPWYQRTFRHLLRTVISRPALFGALLRLGQSLRPLLPPALRRKIPVRQNPGPVPGVHHSRTMLLLEGCVQRAATPGTNAAARRVLDRLGIGLVAAPSAGCCGAVNYHLAAHDDGLDNARRNIDAWWPFVEQGAEAIIASATGCTSMLTEYGELLADDPAYAEKARRITSMVKDLGEILLQEAPGKLAPAAGAGRIALHTPCSQYHALGQAGVVAELLTAAGFELTRTSDDHLCCGSAGTYSILQGERASRLRQKKLSALTQDHPDIIATANVGCQLHLQERAGMPVIHWIELLDGSHLSIE